MTFIRAIVVVLLKNEMRMRFCIIIISKNPNNPYHQRSNDFCDGLSVFRFPLFMLYKKMSRARAYGMATTTVAAKVQPFLKYAIKIH